ncbi:universal stress protein [Fulvivirgaceae bacterium BMA10]|uniref:Universal stress protein n=1 Tax=Splendidivirga corallicola TaxID=3051826 RepID=A0ABT8KUV8_9BACT|nr:universal stress protein [Fulvivirgaceae bacterium BMA10]
MDNLKRWMVGLDLTELDDTLISYTKYLAQIFQPELVFFVHIIRHREYPDGVHIHMPDTSEYNKEGVEQALTACVTKHFNEDEPIEILVFDGKPKFELWKELFVFNIDLFIAGAKEKHKGRGIIPQKFVRRSLCSVLFVPEGVSQKIQKILVPMDFSEPSKQAIEKAVKMADTIGPCSVTTCHAFDSAYGVNFSNLPSDEYIKNSRQAAADQYDQFITSVDLKHQNVELKLLFNNRPSVAELIKDFAEREFYDLIIMSATGKSGFMWILLGSETERIVRIEKKLPVMILKEKKENVKFWDLVSNA